MVVNNKLSESRWLLRESITKDWNKMFERRDKCGKENVKKFDKFSKKEEINFEMQRFAEI